MQDLFEKLRNESKELTAVGVSLESVILVLLHHCTVHVWEAEETFRHSCVLSHIKHERHLDLVLITMPLDINRSTLELRDLVIENDKLHVLLLDSLVEEHIRRGALLIAIILVTEAAPSQRIEREITDIRVIEFHPRVIFSAPPGHLIVRLLAVRVDVRPVMARVCRTVVHVAANELELVAVVTIRLLRLLQVFESIRVALVSSQVL